jgi:O-antigen/teichoic acid export membrane protein
MTKSTNISKGRFQLISGVFTYLSANIIVGLIPFALLPFLTRVLDPDAYGKIAMFQFSIAGLGAFTGLSVHGAVSVNYFKGKKDTFPQFVGNCFFILIISSVATGMLVFGFLGYFMGITGLGKHWLFLAVAVSTAQFVITIRLVIWQIRGDSFRYGVFQILLSLLNASISVFLVLIIKWGEVGRIWGISASVFFFSLVSFYTLWRSGWIQLKWNRKFMKEALLWGIPLIPHVVGGLFMILADRFIITWQLGLEHTGIYYVAVQFASPILMFGTSFNGAFRPWLYDKLANGENGTAVLVSYISMLVFLLVGLSYGITVSLIFPFLVGEKYLNGSKIVLILIFSNTFQILYYTVSNYVLFEGKTKILSMITIAVGITYALGGWFVVISFGLIGLPCLLALMSLIYFVLTWLVSIKVRPNPWFQRKQLAFECEQLLSKLSFPLKKNP